MGIGRATAILALTIGGTASAQAPDLYCSGTSPDWTLALAGEGATLTFIGTAQMTIPHRTRAEGQIWPEALTLISADQRQTAIVILNERICSGSPFEAQVLTQRNETPVLLTGCCAPA